MATKRTAKIERDTAETSIRLSLDLDGSGAGTIDTGIPFFDHMLVLFSRHGLFDLSVTAKGDIAVDYHHTVEDVGIVLGQAFRKALGERCGIRRYGFWVLPMDETLVQVALDLSNRPLLVYRVDSRESMVRDFNIGLVREFCQAFAGNVGANLHVNLLYGEEPHHIAEAIFKALARALDAATTIDPRLAGSLMSTKGTLS
jgi:imidazoleglycerol-phosphate dehydratase